MTGGLQSGFVRAVEAEYAARAARHQAAGLDADAAHERALAEVKDAGRQGLAELQRRGLFPWPEEAHNEASDDTPRPACRAVVLGGMARTDAPPAADTRRRRVRHA